MPLPIVGGIIATAIGWLVKRFGISAVKTSILGAIKVITWAAVITFFTFLISGVTTVFNLIEELLNKFTSLQADNAGENYGAFINQALHCSGIWDGISSMFPIFSGSIVFLFSALLYSMVLSVKDRVERDINDMIRLI